jgi:hypothetical protein
VITITSLGIVPSVRRAIYFVKSDLINSSRVIPFVLTRLPLHALQRPL